MSVRAPPRNPLLPKSKAVYPPHTFSVCVWLRDTGEKFSVPKCRSSMRIGELKCALEVIAGIPSDFQRLSYIDEGDLMDNSTFDGNDIVPRSTITMTVWPYNRWPELVRAAASGDVYMLRNVLFSPALHGRIQSHSGFTPLTSSHWLFSALFVSAHRGKKAAVNFLIKCGADVRGQTPQQRTALHVAARQGHADCVQLLLTHGTPVQLQDCNRLTAWDMATRTGQKDVVRLLFLFRWKVRTSGLQPLPHLEEEGLFAHQRFDSHLRTWFCGPQAQRYMADLQQRQRRPYVQYCHPGTTKKTAQEMRHVEKAGV